MEEKISALLDSDIFITPSYNGFPHTFLQSCACGTPIITTSKGDRLDWIDGNVGVVAEYNKKSLAISIQNILENDSLRNDFKLQCRKTIENQFDWPIIAKKIEKLYLKVINENKIKG